MKIFRAGDIRGIYPSMVNPELGRKIGFAFVKLLNKNGVEKPRIAVGADARLGSKEVREAVIEGIVSAGAHVIDIGHIPSPVVYYTTVTLELDGGIQVTGSHNPKEFLGFKFCGRGAEPIDYDNGIKDMEDFCKSGKEIVSVPGGSKEEKDISEDFINFIAGKTKLSKNLSIVIDAGNGIAGDIAKRLFERIGCKVDCLYCEPDGNFPNHLANPLEKNTLRDLQKRVVETGADMGLAFDGDGDRIGFVDKRGEIIIGDVLFSLLVEDTLKRSPGSKIIYDFICSKTIDDVIRKNGGQPIVSRVGYNFIRKLMRKNGAELSGETSAHFYFKENYGYDDALFAGARILEILCNKNLDEFIESLPKYIVSDDIRIACKDEKKVLVVDEIKKHFQEQNVKISDLDGVKVFFDNGWAAARPSNTTPVIVARWESSDQETFNRIGKFLIDIVNSYIEKYDASE
ncbi:MAG: phosphomannomutase/phosphoglucomutase [Nanoarchaeota archaeon]|nr:phosphomannomutase/phosphoglucomutase [Nanoarchaeota archaeon]